MLVLLFCDGAVCMLVVLFARESLQGNIRHPFRRAVEFGGVEGHIPGLPLARNTTQNNILLTEQLLVVFSGLPSSEIASLKIHWFLTFCRLPPTTIGTEKRSHFC